MARPWRWISTDIGIAADLPSPGDAAEDRRRRPAAASPAQKGQKSLLFCEWVKQRGRIASR
jgi:hypothetical protein